MWTAGIDEVGMGCIAGPVVAAAVILPAEYGITGLRDSKKIKSPAERERLAKAIRAAAVSCAVGSADIEEIERHNVLGASWLAMRRALDALTVKPSVCLVDGGQRPELGDGFGEVRTVPGGDRLHECIMAASILAKVERDAEMIRLDDLYPGYGFATNVGYPTVAGRAALHDLGPSPVHRRGYQPESPAPALTGG